MTLFSSRPPFNDDPEPYVSGVDNRHTTNFNPAIWTYEPRPEYDRPQHNPTNPILTEFRELHSQTGNDLLTDAFLFSSGLWEDYEKYNADEWFHATEVLGGIIRMERMSR